MTLPETDRFLAKRLIDTGIPRDLAWQAIENTSLIADRCNVTLPKAERLRYPIEARDWESWSPSR
jgi:hypothetical protein